MNFLKNQATLLEQELSAIRKRLDEIETKAES
jgi:tetrahydromethanopterin S-methyltransferase subunit G